ncbi:MAG: endo-1,4-beta-xylanase, partial [Planctomycetes bacterium]|nr:endo-1,4-beta-xylanase [Planctomycetota bacterium]
MSLDRLAKLGLPIEVTEFDVDTPDEEAQAADLETFYRVCFAHPSVSAILMWGFWEGAHWRPRGALYARDWREKPAARAYRKLVLGEWRTDLSGTTDAGGRFGGRAFFGTYRVRVEPAEGSPFARETAFGPETSGRPIETRAP